MRWIRSIHPIAHVLLPEASTTKIEEVASEMHSVIGILQVALALLPETSIIKMGYVTSENGSRYNRKLVH
jgi:hypothetical protein